jgi:hypothetical protein
MDPTFDLQTRLYDTERQRDLTQLRLEMTQIHQPAPNQAAPKSRHQHKPKPKQVDYTYYPDGGQCVIWHSNPETPTSDTSDQLPQYVHRTPTPFNITPSPRFAHRRWASRPHSRGTGHPRKSVIVCSNREQTQVHTDLKGEGVDDEDDVLKSKPARCQTPEV